MKLLFVILLTFFTFNAFSQVNYYSDRNSWHTSCVSTLVLEDFNGGPTKSGNTGCDDVFSAAGNNCFPAGEIQPGLIITSSDTTGTFMAYTNIGFVSNPTPIVGTNRFEDFTIMSFPDGNINTVGLDLYGAPAASIMHVRIYSADDLVDSMTITEGMPGPYFFGFTSAQPISSIEFQAAGNSIEMVGMVEFGVCNVVSVTDLDQFDLSLFPNPTTNAVTIKANSEIKSVGILNILGQEVLQKSPISNAATLNVSNLEPGTYFIKVQIAQRTGVYKLVKE